MISAVPELFAMSEGADRQALACLKIRRRAGGTDPPEIRAPGERVPGGGRKGGGAQDTKTYGDEVVRSRSLETVIWSSRLGYRWPALVRSHSWASLWASRLDPDCVHNFLGRVRVLGRHEGLKGFGRVDLEKLGVSEPRPVQPLRGRAPRDARTNGRARRLR